MASLLSFVPQVERNPGEEQESLVAAGSSVTAVPRSPWRTVGVLAGIVSATLLVLFWQTAFSIVKTWSSSRTFSHGFLIVPIFLYLVWIRRDRLARVHPQPNYWGLPILISLACVWLLGSLGDVRVIQQFALVAMLVVMIWTMLGTKTTRVIWFPLAFLIFAVPFGEGAIGPLQDFTARFAVTALRLSHVPVVLEARTIWVPSGPWVVAQACSGIRYLTSSVVLGLVYASLIYRSRKRQILFMAASVLVPILANGIRAYGIIFLAFLTNNRMAAGVDHIIYGWVFFTIIQFLLFMVGLRWREPVFVASSEAADHGLRPERGDRAVGRTMAIAVCILVLVSWAPFAAAYFRQRSMASQPRELIPVVRSPWQLAPPRGAGWLPSLHPVSELQRSYAVDGQTVDLYVGDYSGTRPMQLVSGYNRISDVQFWTEGESGLRSMQIDGQTTSVRWNTIHADSGRRRMVWTWYSVAGRFTANPTKVKVLQAEARLFSRPTAEAVVVLSTDYLLDPSEAIARMEDFLRHTSFISTPSLLAGPS